MVDRPNTPELRDLDVSACTTGISVVAGASNFTLDALLERDFGNNPGFRNTYATGINFNQTFGKKTELNLRSMQR